MNIQDYRRRLLRRLLRRMFRATEARLRPGTTLPAPDIRRILICRPNHRLGNLLMLTPLLVELQRLLPAAEVDIVLSGDRWVELFRTFSNVRHIHVLSRRMVRHPMATIGTVMRIRRAGYDLAVDPARASQSGRLLLAATGAPYMIGLPRQSDTATPATTDALPTTEHMAQWPVALLRRALSGSHRALDDGYPALTIHLSQTERATGRQVLDALLPREGESRGRTTIGVFAEATGTKRYDEIWWDAFIAAVRAMRPDCAIVEIAPPDGHSRLSSRFPVFSSPSAREVAAVISHMTCFISADCGVMHLAFASGAPTAGLFCVTSIAKYAPYGPHDQAIDTNGRRAEDAAGLVGAMLDTIRSNGTETRPPLGAAPYGESIGSRAS